MVRVENTRLFCTITLCPVHMDHTAEVEPFTTIKSLLQTATC